MRELIVAGLVVCVLVGCPDRARKVVVDVDAAPAARDRTVMTVGRAAAVDRNVRYTVEGTKLALTVKDSSMAHASDSSGHETEYVMMTLDVSLDGASGTLALREGAPVVWQGYSFQASSAGFAWSGAGAGTLTITR